MDYLAAQTIIFIKANPEWSVFVIGLTAFGESFVFLSLLFPGTALLIAAGTLVSEGALNAIPVISAGIIGAILGDMVSFWLGRKFGPALTRIWPFREHPERLGRGVTFFQQFGGSSVFIGRFFGPFRAAVPLAAGMMRMQPLPFYTANILSALIWAPALVLFGDRLARLLGQENLTTKILTIGITIAAVAVLAAWVRRRVLSR